jgi:outer membrane lipoprotein SlyB
MKKKLVWFLMLFSFTVLVFATVKTVPAQSPSPADCDAYARNEANRSTGSALGGAVVGGAGGAAFGAIVGDSSKAAKRGAALGAVVGGVSQASKKNSVQQRAYDDCMSGRVKW